MLNKQLTSQEVENIKKQLLARKYELDEEFAQLKEPFADTKIQDVGDQALTSVMESLRNSLQNSSLDEYQRVTKALAMIEDGTYGICGDCGNAIPEKRLESFPNASRCLACQEIYEEQAKHA